MKEKEFPFLLQLWACGCVADAGAGTWMPRWEAFVKDREQRTEDLGSSQPWLTDQPWTAHTPWHEREISFSWVLAITLLAFVTKDEA